MPGIGEMLQKIRGKHGESQEELAKAINTTRQQIYRYEKGTQDITAIKLAKICQHYNISADELLGLKIPGEHPNDHQA